MPNTVLTFNVEDRRARAAFSRLKREVDALDREFTTTQRGAREAGAAIDRLGDRSRTTAMELERLQAAHVNTTAHSEHLQNAQRGLTAANTRTTTTAQNASKATDNFARALAQLRANADATRDALPKSRDAQQFAATFQTATDASTAYYTERIRQAAAARSAEKAGSEAFTQLHVEIFQLGRQQLAAQRQLATERTHIARTFSRERVRMEQSANTEMIAGFSTVVQAAKEAVRARLAFAQQLAAIPDIQSPDAPYGKPLTSGVRRDFQETERQGRSLLSLMQEIANLAYGTDVEARLPDPLDRGVAIAEAARGAQVLTDMRQTAAEQGRHSLRRVHRSEERDTESSLTARARHYRHFTNLVSKTFVDLAAGRARSFESVATTFIEHSIRLMSRAVIENQLLKRLDDGLTVSKLANLRKVAAARAGSGLASGGGLGGLIGQVPGFGTLGGALSGGGFALGAASLLFPKQIHNITGGIADTLKGVLENVSRQPVVVKANIQNNLRIGENEAREISDIQAEMRAEDRL